MEREIYIFVYICEYISRFISSAASLLACLLRAAALLEHELSMTHIFRRDGHRLDNGVAYDTRGKFKRRHRTFRHARQ